MTHYRHTWLPRLVQVVIWGWLIGPLLSIAAHAEDPALRWRALPGIPNSLGLAGPIVGLHNDMLICAGGANFERPVWDNHKQWHQALYGLDLKSPKDWQRLQDLPQPMAYSACVSTPFGIVVIGGNDASQTFRTVWLITIARDAQAVTARFQSLQDLPTNLTNSQAVWLDQRIVLCGGQTDLTLRSATDQAWELLLPTGSDVQSQTWRPIPNCPGGPRSLAELSSIGDDDHQLLVMSGRRESSKSIEFLRDVWLYNTQSRSWTARAELPVPVAAGGAGPIGNGLVAVVSGDEGSLYHQTDALRDSHPGFPKRTWIYDAQRDQWRSGGASPSNQVTTIPVSLPGTGKLIVISGEIRPRVRTDRVWEVGL